MIVRLATGQPECFRVLGRMKELADRVLPMDHGRVSLCGRQIVFGVLAVWSGGLVACAPGKLHTTLEQPLRLTERGGRQGTGCVA